MRHLLLILVSTACLLVLAPALTAQSNPPSPTAQPQASQPEKPLYTESQVDRAIKAASEAAAKTAVAEAVPAAVNIALADQAQRIGWTVTAWRSGCLVASGAALGALADGPRGALYGAAGGALSALVYELGHRLFRVW